MGGSGWKHKTVSFEQPSKFILLLILLGISFYGERILFLISRRGVIRWGVVLESLGCTEEEMGCLFPSYLELDVDEHGRIDGFMCIRGVG